MNPLYVVTCVYNPRRFKSRPKLYTDFAKWVADAGSKLITVEIAFGERPFVVTEFGNPYHLQLRTSTEIWHKERALNLGVHHLSRLHPDWKYFCYLDCDVKIMRDGWPDETVHLLQHYAILQMFGEIQTLDPSHHILYGGRSLARNWHETGHFTLKPDKEDSCNEATFKGGDSYNEATFKLNKSLPGWPGLGWAYRRPEFEKIGGLFDVAVTGSGDTHMAGAYCGRYDWGIRTGMSPGFKRSLERYAELCEKYVRKNVSYVPGLLIHYWHGNAKQRGYDKRNDAVVEHLFDPHEDLVIDAQGLYTWAAHKWDLERALRRSMEARNEDSIDIL